MSMYANTGYSQAILKKIRQMSKSDVVYDPLPQFVKAREGEEVTVDWKSVPGLREWFSYLSLN